MSLFGRAAQQYVRHAYCALRSLPADLTLMQRVAILKAFGVWRSW